MTRSETSVSRANYEKIKQLRSELSEDFTRLRSYPDSTLETSENDKSKYPFWSVVLLKVEALKRNRLISDPTYTVFEKTFANYQTNRASNQGLATPADILAINSLLEKLITETRR